MYGRNKETNRGGGGDLKASDLAMDSDSMTSTAQTTAAAFSVSETDPTSGNHQPPVKGGKPAAHDGMQHDKGSKRPPRALTGRPCPFSSGDAPRGG
jgi:hypothetical protein